MSDLFTPLTFARGPAMKNRFMLAPLTNWQSAPDGRLSDEEITWLNFRAAGGFGHVMTAAAHVQRIGQGFPGQLGTFSDDHLDGLSRLAADLRAKGAVSSVQLHHAGIRSPAELTGAAPVGPSDDAETGARSLSTGEVEQLIEDFVAAAVRAQQAGFDGVELHGANGYLPDQFLRDGVNQRTDAYGGQIENRARFHLEATQALIEVWGADRVGVRISPSGTFNDMSDSKPRATFSYLAEKLDDLGIVYLHVVEATDGDLRHGGHNVPVSYFRPLFHRALIANGGYTLERAQQTLAAGDADAIAFGVLFLANPDLPERFRRGAELNAPDPNTFYVGGEKGYVDYPSLAG